MAKGRKARSNDENGANLGFENKLWCHSAGRNYNDLENRNYDNGFRLTASSSGM
jgi:hypothetical protein